MAFWGTYKVQCYRIRQRWLFREAIQRTRFRIFRNRDYLWSRTNVSKGRGEMAEETCGRRFDLSDWRRRFWLSVLNIQPCYSCRGYENWFIKPLIVKWAIKRQSRPQNVGRHWVLTALGWNLQRRLDSNYSCSAYRHCVVINLTGFCFLYFFILEISQNIDNYPHGEISYVRLIIMCLYICNN